MRSYLIEVDEELDKILGSAAALKNMSVEKLITLLLHRFALDPHSMKVEDMQSGYVSCGDLNLEWANLK
ncbi:MAG: hypothetical protein HFK09_04435 [Clostridia bacterium]|nr:hypothetical protein [Clostridia bacterium]